MYQVEDGRLIGYEENSNGEIIIPDFVTSIGAHVFEKKQQLTSVIFPSGLKTIGEDAFADCPALESLSFQEGLKRLGQGCFRHCSGLHAAMLPDSVVSIHPRAFQGCSRLSQINLPKGLRRNIESDTFAGCLSLESICIPQGIQQIKSGAFSGCTALKHVSFDNENVLIEKDAFRNCPALTEESSAFIQSHIIDQSSTNISSKASGAAGRLSNFTPRQFLFDGVVCASIEGVLQSFKCPDPKRQAEICALTGGWAKHAGSQYEWKEQQLLYWQGHAFPRRSEDYQNLLDRLYLAVYEQDASFRQDLAEIRGKKIDHRMGLSNPSETVLTRHEFIFRLQRLSEK